MKYLLNTTLLKEYIQTLTHGEIRFPSVAARPWGCEFSRAEQEVICQSVTMLGSLAHQTRYNTLIDQIEMGVEPDTVHWLPIEFWADLAELMNEKHVCHP